MFSFKNDLGIIPNEGTSYENDANLLQGQQFMEYARVYSSSIKPHLYKLQLTSSPALQSIVEALYGSDSINAKNNNIKTVVTNTETEFNKTLSEYSDTYKELSKELLAINAKNKPIQKYFNKVITTDDVNYTYVNNYGYTHKYSNESWIKNDKSCTASTPIKITSSDLLLLNNSGPDMGVGQSCNIAGQNVKNITTNEIAWVDANGYKHVYPSTIWEKKNTTCNNDVKSLDSISYTAIPSGSPMSETTPCNKLNISPSLIEKLSNINNKLIKQAEKINSEIGNLTVNEDKLQNSINDQRAKLNDYINNLKNDKKKFDAYNNTDIYNSIIGQAEVSHLSMRSNYLHYIIWGFLLLFLFFITINAFVSESYGAIIVIFILFVLYMVLKNTFSTF
jgi:hypothetical protein